MSDITVQVEGDKALDLYNAEPTEHDVFRVYVNGRTRTAKFEDATYGFDDGEPTAKLELAFQDDD